MSMAKADAAAVNLETQEDLMVKQAPRRWTALTLIALTLLFASIAATAIAVPIVLTNRQPLAAAPPTWATSAHKFAAGAIHPGLYAPAFASANGKVLNQSLFVADPAGRGNLTLTYTAELKDDPLAILALDYDTAVVDVGCFDDGLLHLRMTPAAALGVHPGLVITGSAWWGCRSSQLYPTNTSGANDTTPSTIMHRVVRVVTDRAIANPYGDTPPQLMQLSVLLERCTFTDIFKHVSINYHNTLPPDNQTETGASSSSSSAASAAASSGSSRRRLDASRRRLGWFHRVIHHVEHAASHVAHDVETVVAHVANDAEHAGKDVIAVAKAAVTGDVNVDHSRNFVNFHWPAPGTPPYSIGSGADKIDLGGASVSITAGTKVVLEIHDYHMENAEVAALANTDMKASLDGAPQRLSYTKTYSDTPVSGLKLGELDFMIGPVPIHAVATFDVHVSASFKATETLQMSGSAYATSSAAYGIQWKDGHWQKLNQANFQHSQQAPSLHSTEAADFRISVAPSLRLSVDKLADVTANAQPYIHAHLQASEEFDTQGSRYDTLFHAADANNDGVLEESEFKNYLNGQDQLAKCDGISANVDWGVNVDVTAAIDFQLPPHELDKWLQKFDHTYGPWNVYSEGPVSLYHNCIQL